MLAGSREVSGGTGHLIIQLFSLVTLGDPTTTAPPWEPSLNWEVPLSGWTPAASDFRGDAVAPVGGRAPHPGSRREDLCVPSAPLGLRLGSACDPSQCCWTAGLTQVTSFPVSGVFKRRQRTDHVSTAEGPRDPVRGHCGVSARLLRIRLNSVQSRLLLEDLCSFRPTPVLRTCCLGRIGVPG